MARLRGTPTPRVTLTGQRLLQWRLLAETWGEMRKVTWPSREDTLRLTIAVIALATAVGIALGTIDFFFSFLARFTLGG